MGVDVSVEFPELQALKAAFRELRPSLARKHMGAAIRRSLAPGLQALRTKTPRGPTGNLKRAITSKVKTYRSGNAVGLVGYVAAGSGKSSSARGGTVRAGKDRAFHAGFLEFGTKNRRTKGIVASSYNTLGKFAIKRIAKRGKFAGVARVQTSPAYPKAFFKKVPAGQTVDLKEMPKGGRLGEPPVRSAYQQALGSMRGQLSANMAIALQKALKDLAGDFPPKRSETGPGPTPF